MGSRQIFVPFDPDSEPEELGGTGQVQAFTQSLDDLFDEIGSVLEASAEALIQGFVQKGGQ